MKLLLDANIYLNFYKTSNEVLGNIDRVIEVIEKNNFSLILPSIILEEVEYNKFRGIDEFLAVVKSRSEGFPVPAFLRETPEVKRLLKEHKKFKATGKEVAKIGVDKIENSRSHVNQKVSKLMGKAELDEVKQSHIDSANFRHSRQYPPSAPKKKGKRPSLGDSVVWELLLANHCDQDMVIVSNDSDYARQNDSETIDQYLAYEWEQAHGKKLTLHTTLGGFMNSYLGDEEKIKEETIEEERLASNIPLFVSDGASSSVVFASPGPMQLADMLPQPAGVQLVQDNIVPHETHVIKCLTCGEEYNLLKDVHICNKVAL